MSGEHDIEIRLRPMCEGVAMSEAETGATIRRFIDARVPAECICPPILPILQNLDNLDTVKVEGIRARHVLELLRR